MGIYVRAYRQLTPGEAELRDGVDPVDPVTKAYIGDTCMVAFVNPFFPQYADQLQHQGVYNFAEKVHVIHTAYTHYSEWLQELTKMVKESSGRPGSFEELIVQANSASGLIGPVTSAKLAEDFNYHDPLARAVSYPDFYLIYTNFRRGFEAASDNGAVVLS